MQKIGNRKAMPKLRFQEFTGEWEKNQVWGSLESFISTNSFSRNMLNYEEGDVRNIHYGEEIFKQSLILIF